MPRAPVTALRRVRGRRRRTLHRIAERNSLVRYRLPAVSESNKETIAAAVGGVVGEGVRAGLDDDPEGPEDRPQGREDQPEAWPYKKVLLAVLPPTLALFSVLIGVWDNGNRDRAAQAEAEKDRAAEVEKNQETAEKESRLREAELVLPKYVDLLEAVHATRSVTNLCASAVNANLAGVVEWGGGGAVGTAVYQELGGPLKTAIDPEVVESCSEVEATIDPLELTFDKALLVSDDSLEGAASDLTIPLTAASETAQHLLAAIRTEDDGRFYVTDDVDDEGRSWEEVALVLTDELTRVEPAADDLISKVQGVVVELEP